MAGIGFFFWYFWMARIFFVLFFSWLGVFAPFCTFRGWDYFCVLYFSWLVLLFVLYLSWLRLVVRFVLFVTGIIASCCSFCCWKSSPSFCSFRGWDYFQFCVASVAGIPSLYFPWLGLFSAFCFLRGWASFLRLTLFLARISYRFALLGGFTRA